jgi:hypothetical protein
MAKVLQSSASPTARLFNHGHPGPGEAQGYAAQQAVHVMLRALVGTMATCLFHRIHANVDYPDPEQEQTRQSDARFIAKQELVIDVSGFAPWYPPPPTVEEVVSEMNRWTFVAGYHDIRPVITTKRKRWNQSYRAYVITFEPVL